MNLLEILYVAVTSVATALHPSPALKKFDDSPSAGRIAIGNRTNVLPQVHVGLSTGDVPVARTMYNIYQLDQRYADLFGDNGSSQLCGPAAMSNAMIYLKFHHTPRFPTILQSKTTNSSTLEDYVRTLFKMCNTDRNEGTRLFSLTDCAKASLADGGYETTNTFVRGMHSNFDSHRVAVTPNELVAVSQNTWEPGDSTFESDRAVILLFGWYKVIFDGNLQKWRYEREGGHFVTLAGYDKNDATKAYVSNPLVNYDAVAPGLPAMSKIRLEPVPVSTNVIPPGNTPGLWQTADIVEGRASILEDMIVSVPVF